MKLIRTRSVLWVVLLCAACASTPEADPERDAEAKRFEPVTRDAVIYVYRPDMPGTSTDTTLWADARLVGASLPGTYFRIIVLPGRNVLETSPPDGARIEINTLGNDVTFVEMRTWGGSEGSPSSTFRLVSPELGKKALLECCTMLEVWRYGKQPLLLW